MHVSVIGSGSFGTSIAQSISKNVDIVNLFGRNKAVLNSINKHRLNKHYFPATTLSENIKCYELAKHKNIIPDSDLVIFALPSGVTREVADKLKSSIKDIPVLSTSKGIEFPSLKTMSEVIKDVSGNKRVFSMSGPTFADEVINKSFSCATIGINIDKDKKVLMKALDIDNFVFDYSKDVSGVELCGVLKNIYSIAVGIFDSFSNSSNEHYAFLNLCFKEMGEILNEFSDDKDLILKFCAFGDFNLTTNSDKSRNRTLGMMVGKGMLNISEFNPSIIFEGLKSIKAIKEKSNNSKLNVPIVKFVYDSLNKSGNIKFNLNKLLSEIKTI